MGSNLTSAAARQIRDCETLPRFRRPSLAPELPGSPGRLPSKPAKSGVADFYVGADIAPTIASDCPTSCAAASCSGTTRPMRHYGTATRLLPPPCAGGQRALRHGKALPLLPTNTKAAGRSKNPMHQFAGQPAHHANRSRDGNNPCIMRHIAMPDARPRVSRAATVRHATKQARLNADAEKMHAKHADRPGSGTARHGRHRTAEPGEPRRGGCPCPIRVLCVHLPASA